MKLKKFNEYIKEDTSSVYDIEKPFMGDGDNLSTQDDESQDGMHDSGDSEGTEFEKPLYSEEGEAIDAKGEISKIDMMILQKIASGEIDVAAIAQEILSSMEGGIEGEEHEDDESEHEEHEEHEHGDDNYGFKHEEDEEGKFYPQLSLEESLKFKNFKRRK